MNRSEYVISCKLVKEKEVHPFYPPDVFFIFEEMKVFDETFFGLIGDDALKNFSIGKLDFTTDPRQA